MTRQQKDAVNEGLLEISVISSLILRLANSTISGMGSIEGPELAWLVNQLDRVEQATSEAVASIRPVP